MQTDNLRILYTRSSIYLSIYLPIYLSVCLSVCLSVLSIDLSVYRSIDLSIYLSIYLDATQISDQPQVGPATKRPPGQAAGMRANSLCLRPYIPTA